jgi:hypothetical protein
MSFYSLKGTGQCSILTCHRCLERSGAATRFCVVCRRTSRGEELLYPGKERFDHGHCTAAMREFADHPEDAGCFDLCDCKAE